jgi:hypothetical protein
MKVLREEHLLVKDFERLYTFHAQDYCLTTDQFMSTMTYNDEMNYFNEFFESYLYDKKFKDIRWPMDSEANEV